MHGCQQIGETRRMRPRVVVTAEEKCNEMKSYFVAAKWMRCIYYIRMEYAGPFSRWVVGWKVVFGGYGYLGITVMFD